MSTQTPSDVIMRALGTAQDEGMDRDQIADSIIAALHSAGYVVERGWEKPGPVPEGTPMWLTGLGTDDDGNPGRWHHEGYWISQDGNWSICPDGFGAELEPDGMRPLPAPPAAETEG